MRKVRTVFISLLAFLLVCGVGVYWTHIAREMRQNEQRFFISELVGAQASAIERRLERSLSATRILAQEVLQHRGLFDNFDAYAEEVIRTVGGISNLQLAPDGVVQYIHPLAGNEKAIGHNILQLDARREEALRAIREHRLTLAGPFELVQGGVAIIGRNPVFLPSDSGERFWGFASALIYLDDLLRVTELSQWEAKGYSYQLSHRPPGSKQWLIFAHSAAEPGVNAFTKSINLPNSVWHLTMSQPPVSGSTLYYGYFFSVLAGALMALLVWNAARQPEILRRVVAQKTRELEQMANQDHLTGLTNRRFLTDQLSRVLRDSQRSDSSAALLYLDLDDFKRVNDTLGHYTGDRCLKKVAQRIQDCVREGDIVSRLGGDEFGILLQHSESVRDIVRVAEKLIAEVRRPILIDNRSFVLSASIGITMIPQDGEDVTTLLRNADMAMYAGKRSGKRRYNFYDRKLQAAAIEKIELEHDLLLAIEQEQFVLHYQPVFALDSGVLRGYEALVRWQHPERGLLYPDSFIAVAEESGRIVEVGYLVLEQACRQIKQLEQMNACNLRIAVNLSPRQFKDPLLPESIRDILQKHSVDPHMLELEITESCLMDDVARAIEVLSQFCQMGISIAIDDFGTGYSSLSMLKRLPVNKLKIDRSFIADLVQDIADRKIVQGLITMAHKLQLSVVAEGIETEAQLHLLQAYRCDLGQGYLFSRPLPSDQAFALPLRSMHFSRTQENPYSIGEPENRQHSDKVVRLASDTDH